MLFFRRTLKDKKCIKYFRIMVPAGLLCCTLFAFAGCGTSSSTTSAVAVSTGLGTGIGNVFTVANENCSRQEVKVILIQFQKEYRSRYGIDVWNSDAVNSESLASYIKNAAISQLANVYSLDAVAEAYGIVLTDEEEEQTQAAADTYVGALDNAEKKYTGISGNDAEKLFERYLLAGKAYDAVIATVSTEVSDDEALVMDMQQIRVSDEELAEDLLDRIRGGADFTALADSYNEDRDIEIAVSRTTFDESVTEQLFALEEGEFSDVIRIDDMYCLFCCETYFDEKRTEENKENVLEQRRETAVQDAILTYADPAKSTLNGNVWSKVEVDFTLELSGPSFREVYEQYFS